MLGFVRMSASVLLYILLMGRSSSLRSSRPIVLVMTFGHVLPNHNLAEEARQTQVQKKASHNVRVYYLHIF